MVLTQRTEIKLPTKVYLVEDYVLMRESLRARLEVEPEIAVVGEASDAESAIKELQTLEVDLILMDIQLPGMDGIEALRQIKSTRPEIAVVMLTGFADQYVGSAIEAGASGYILKSSTTQELLHSINVAGSGQVALDPSLTTGLFKEVAQLKAVNKQSLLTDRQVEILKSVADGIRYRDIAQRLFVSETTVNRDMRTIFDALDVTDAAHAVAVAFRRGLM